MATSAPSSPALFRFAGDTKSFAPGSSFAEGDPGDLMYGVKEGQVVGRSPRIVEI